jgi:hypothetical protein
MPGYTHAPIARGAKSSASRAGDKSKEDEDGWEAVVCGQEHQESSKDYNPTICDRRLGTDEIGGSEPPRCVDAASCTTFCV